MALLGAHWKPGEKPANGRLRSCQSPPEAHKGGNPPENIEGQTPLSGASARPGRVSDGNDQRSVEDAFFSPAARIFFGMSSGASVAPARNSIRPTASGVSGP